MNATIEQIRAARALERASREQSEHTEREEALRFGFEYETNESDGLTMADCEDPWDRAYEIVNGYSLSEIMDLIVEYDAPLSPLDSHTLEHVLRRMGINSLYEYDEEFGTSLREACVDGEAESLEGEQNWPDVDGLETGEDGTVRGFEFRTVGGRTLDMTEALLTNLLTNHSHTTGWECGFHVHVSDPTVPHEYSSDVQLRMVNYILKHVELLPKCVQRRIFLTSLGRDDFFFLDRTYDDKNHAVSFRGMGTWEFRLFGNFTGIRAGKACLHLAKWAMMNRFNPDYDATQTDINNLFSTIQQRVRDENEVSTQAEAA